MRLRAPAIRRLAVLAPLLAAAVVASTAGPTVAQGQSNSRGPMFDFGREVPELRTPRPHEVPDYDRYARRVRFAVDAERLPQTLSAGLSDACGRNSFNQKYRGHFYVDVPMPDGPTERFGFAGSNGLNLRDPQGRAGADQVYLFKRDGTSECRVYVFPMTW